jgi:hypothetical protein
MSRAVKKFGRSVATGGCRRRGRSVLVLRAFLNIDNLKSDDGERKDNPDAK